jgi:hypothetical protein
MLTTSLTRESREQIVLRQETGLLECCPASARYENKSDNKLFDIAYLDPERLLPVLIPKAA